MADKQIKQDAEQTLRNAAARSLNMARASLAGANALRAKKGGPIRQKAAKVLSKTTEGVVI